MGHNCLHVRFFLLDMDSDLDLRSVDLDLDLPSLKRTWTRTWTCSLKVDLDLNLRIVDLDLDFTVAGLVTSLIRNYSLQANTAPAYSGVTCQLVVTT